MFITIALVLPLCSCALFSQKPVFNPKTCLEETPSHVEGLTIVSGPRSKKNVIRDMVYPVCSGHALFKHMQSKGHDIQTGRVVFRVIVEYTGEVAHVGVEESTVQSDLFVREVSDFIMDTDFVLWGGDDTDTVFLYPVEFGQ
jgi:hypothetical protein